MDQKLLAVTLLASNFKDSNVLREALKDPARSVRWAAAAAYSQDPPPEEAIPVLLDILDNSRADSESHYLAADGLANAPSVFPVVEKMLSATADRAQALAVLEKVPKDFDGTPIRGLLLKLLRDPDRNISESASRIIAAHARNGFTGYGNQFLELARSTKSERTRANLIEALGALAQDDTKILGALIGMAVLNAPGSSDAVAALAKVRPYSERTLLAIEASLFAQVKG